jgi:ABC-type molybdate transport system permease subunit
VADLLLLSPLVLPPTVLGFLLLQLLGPQGPLGAPLEGIGISVVFSWSATVISAAVVAFPLMYRSTLASLEQLDPALEAVALGLGCSPVRAFWRAPACWRA